MSDIDFSTDLNNGQFTTVIDGNPRKVTGNRALMNRFEITFFTRARVLKDGDTILVDGFGGNADLFINQPYVLNNKQAIMVALSTAVEQTVKALQGDELAGTPPTERIQGASVTSLDVINEFLVARIQVIPVEVESFDILKFNLPITRV